ncbi:MAG: DNA mismatch repair protein MutS, partial [Myxococcales bacterium]|nr:DNA mismatch repair protein MutS [Myxococcales bacterium]
MKMTPMLHQYFDAKEKHPDALLFFRMGDFYELFFEDAVVASEVLDITLTSRNKGEEDEIPMAGVPHHAAEGYIQRLVAEGHLVAICEQVEKPSEAKGIVRREVVRVVTPGVRVDVDPEKAKEGNYLASVAPIKGTTSQAGLAVAMVDVSTGEVAVSEVASWDSLFLEARRASARELLVPDSLERDLAAAQSPERIHISYVSAKTGSASGLDKHLRELLAEHATHSLRMSFLDPKAVRDLIDHVEGLGLRHADACQSALVQLLHYVARVQMGIPSHIRVPEAHLPTRYVALDSATEANLEIFEALIGGGRAGSLLSVVDKTVTSAGARRLRAALAYPLTEVAAIHDRLDAVGAFVGREAAREQFRHALRTVADLPRLTGRVVAGRANARDLRALVDSLSLIPGIQAQAVTTWDKESPPRLLATLFDALDPCEELVELLDSALVEDPPVSTADGGMFKRGYDEALDELLELSTNGKNWLLQYELTQKQRTGIDSLKLKYNKVFGYYLEVTKANLDKVPDDFMRKQTLANAERYFTAELKEYEDKILHAEDRRKRLEADLFDALVEGVVEQAQRIQTTAAHLADLDMFTGFAELAVRHNYVRPTINDGLVTAIEEGRHPVVERTGAGERFVPNSVDIDAKGRQLLVVTGPNMAGKSTIIRQVALIQLLAQVGSFVPAKRADLGVVDQIFSRVGANDNLAQGQSTFMVEMTQTAHILKHATQRSLIILDEIGRGTSTFDGLAIAWAVAEHILDQIGARTMFATHYHELTEIVRTRERAHNVSVAVKEWNDDIV